MRRFWSEHPEIKLALSRGKQRWKGIVHYSENRYGGRMLLSLLRQLRPGERRIWYFCAPLHGNLGDQAQRLSIREWLMEQYSEFTTVEIPTRYFLSNASAMAKELDRLIGGEDILLFQSGYTMSDIHPDERVRQIAASRWKDHRIVLFPQTICYRLIKNQRRMGALLSNCPRLLLMARDPVSYALAKEMVGEQRAALYPDVVVRWVDRWKPKQDGNRDGIVLCARRDGERAVSDLEWRELVRGLEHFGIPEVLDTSCSEQADYRSPVEALILHFSQVRLVITDRYHGILFALAAGTPVVVLPTNDHKLSSGGGWLAEHYLGRILMAASVKEALLLAQTAIETEDSPQWGGVERYYSGEELKKRIEEL